MGYLSEMVSKPVCQSKNTRKAKRFKSLVKDIVFTTLNVNKSKNTINAKIFKSLVKEIVFTSLNIDVLPNCESISESVSQSKTL